MQGHFSFEINHSHWVCKYLFLNWLGRDSKRLKSNSLYYQQSGPLAMFSEIEQKKKKTSLWFSAQESAFLLKGKSDKYNVI